jgi:hypothetical protein
MEQWQHTAAQGRIRFALKAPVAFTAQVGNPKIRIPHTGHIVTAAGFQQQNVGIGILCQPARNHRARRARAADDEVVPRPQRVRQQLLINANPFGQLELMIRI